jgi:hypothetical protein
MNRREAREAIKRIKKWYGVCPPEVLADSLHCTVEEAKQIIEVIDVPTEKVVPEKKPPVKRAPRKKVEPKVEPVKPIKHNELAMKVLPVAAVIIALLAVTRSIIFTFSYFNRTESFFIALLMATLFGLVSIIGPSVAIYAVKSKRITMAVFALFIYGIFTYMNVDIVVKELDVSKTTIEAKVDTNVDKVLAARARVSDIDRQVNDLTIQINDDRVERIAVQAKAELVDGWEYNRHRNNLAVLKDRIDANEVNKALLLSEKNSLTTIDGYYSMVVESESDRDSKRNLDYVLGFSLEVVGPVFTIFALFL